MVLKEEDGNVRLCMCVCEFSFGGANGRPKCAPRQPRIGSNRVARCDRRRDRAAGACARMLHARGGAAPRPCADSRLYRRERRPLCTRRRARRQRHFARMVGSGRRVRQTRLALDTFCAFMACVHLRVTTVVRRHIPGRTLQWRMWWTLNAASVVWTVWPRTHPLHAFVEWWPWAARLVVGHVCCRDESPSRVLPPTTTDRPWIVRARGRRWRRGWLL